MKKVDRPLDQNRDSREFYRQNRLNDNSALVECWRTGMWFNRHTEGKKIDGHWIINEAIDPED